MTFEECFERGRIGESAVLEWMIANGWHVLPAYDVEHGHFRGPAIYPSAQTAQRPMACPDLLCFGCDGSMLWMEVKTKTAMTWGRAYQAWNTGIELRDLKKYCQVQHLAPQVPIWMAFLHLGTDEAKDTPEGMVSPKGLFIQSLEYLAQPDHQCHVYGSMVYWQPGAFLSPDEFLLRVGRTYR